MKIIPVKTSTLAEFDRDPYHAAMLASLEAKADTLP